MCGIIGITSDGDNVVPMLVDGLKRLEYRGYDSVGIAVLQDGNLVVRKAAGKIDDVSHRLGFLKLESPIGIGHTRWATHGSPKDVNAHPHVDCSSRIALVHNGIIKNYSELKDELISAGHVFRSETDTEVIAHLVEDGLAKGLGLWEAFRQAVKRLRGSYAIALISTLTPNTIFFAKKDSPLIVGLGSGTNYVASDIPAFLPYTRRIIVLRDGEAGYITPRNVYIEDMEKNGTISLESRIRIVTWSPSMAAKGGYPHFMLKEIHEQPRALKDTYYGVIGDEALEKAARMAAESGNIFITAAGTSYHASLLYAYYMARLASRPVTAFIASEYKAYSSLPRRGDLLVAVSQSGETMDTLKAVRAFRKAGARVVTISNVVDSAIPRESDISVYTRAGPEIGVAATKTFLTQVLVLLLFAARTSAETGELTTSEYREIENASRNAWRLTEQSIAMSEGIAKALSKWLSSKKNLYVLSRDIGVPIAMEGALKIKEIAYLHAEAYPAGESKHGPIALVEPGFPVFFLLIEEHLDELKGNIQEMKARGAKIIIIGPRRREVEDDADIYIRVPKTPPLFEPFTLIPPLQLTAYYTAVELGYDPDKPRNLAKTVTVE